MRLAERKAEVLGEFFMKQVKVLVGIKPGRRTRSIPRAKKIG